MCIDEDYVRTAESKGLTSKVIRGRHILRNALLPVVTTIGLQTGGLLVGRRAHRDGLLLRRHRRGRRRGVHAPRLRRAPGAASCMAAIIVIVNLLVDIAYAVIDPRVRTR